MNEPYDRVDLDELARRDPDIAAGLQDLRRRAVELEHECTSPEEFGEMLGFDCDCEMCGRKGLEADDFTDCDLVMDDDPEVFGHLVCNSCLDGADTKKVTWQGLISNSTGEPWWT